MARATSLPLRASALHNPSWSAPNSNLPSLSVRPVNAGRLSWPGAKTRTSVSAIGLPSLVANWTVTLCRANRSSGAAGDGTRQATTIAASTARTRRNGRIFTIMTQDSENDAVRLPLVLLDRIGARLERPRAGRHRRHLRHALSRGIAWYRIADGLRPPGSRRRMALDDRRDPRSLLRSRHRQQRRATTHLIGEQRCVGRRDARLNEPVGDLLAPRGTLKQDYRLFRNGGGPQLI